MVIKVHNQISLESQKASHPSLQNQTDYQVNNNYQRSQRHKTWNATKMPHPNLPLEISLPRSCISSGVQQNKKYLSHSKEGKSKAAATDLHSSSSYFKDKFMNVHDEPSFVLQPWLTPVAHGIPACFQSITKDFLQEPKLSVLEQL